MLHQIINNGDKDVNRFNFVKSDLNLSWWYYLWEVELLSCTAWLMLNEILIGERTISRWQDVGEAHQAHKIAEKAILNHILQC